MMRNHNEKTVFIKRRWVIGVIALAVLSAFLITRAVLINRAENRIARKYGEYIDAGSLSVKGFASFNVRESSWTVFFESDGMSFKVNLLNGSDDFAENYIERLYAELVLSQCSGLSVSSVSVPFVQLLPGEESLDSLDHIFFLEVSFDCQVNTKDDFVKSAETVLAAIDRAGLSRCDTLDMFATVGGRLMEICISPMDMPSEQDIYKSVEAFPSDIN